MEKHQQINVVDNFLSKEELEFASEILIHESKWKKNESSPANDRRQHYTLKDSHNLDLIEFDRKIKQRTLNEIEKFYGQLFFTPINLSFNRWMVGDSQGAHCDNGHADGELILEKRGNEPPPVPISEHLNDVGAVLYFTEEFSGGEIFFDRLGYQVKPKAGMLITFPAYHSFTHGVKELIEGERITMTSFWVSVRSVALTLTAKIYKDWHERVYDPDKIYTLLPREVIPELPNGILPSGNDR